MDFEEASSALNDFVGKVESKLAERGMIAATEGMMASYIDRIYEKGLDSNDSKTGDYSRKPGYFTKQQFVRTGAFKPVGKTGETKFTKGKKAGKNHQSMYLKGGYGELREIQGRQSQTIDASYTGSLRINTTAARISEDVYCIALTSEAESKKRKGLEKQKGKAIFSPSKSDVEAFGAALDAEIEQIRKDL